MKKSPKAGQSLYLRVVNSKGHSSGHTVTVTRVGECYFYVSGPNVPKGTRFRSSTWLHCGTGHRKLYLCKQDYLDEVHAATLYPLIMARLKSAPTNPIPLTDIRALARILKVGGKNA
jgi:hypothetical protein